MIRHRKQTLKLSAATGKLLALGEIELRKINDEPKINLILSNNTIIDTETFGTNSVLYIIKRFFRTFQAWNAWNA